MPVLSCERGAWRKLPEHQGVGGLIICDGGYIGCVGVKQTSESTPLGLEFLPSDRANLKLY